MCEVNVNVSEKAQQSQNLSVSKQTFSTHMQEVLHYAETEGKEKVLPLFDEFDKAVCDYLAIRLVSGEEDGTERERMAHGCSKIMRRFFELESVYSSETGKAPFMVDRANPVGFARLAIWFFFYPDRT